MLFNQRMCCIHLGCSCVVSAVNTADSVALDRSDVHGLDTSTLEPTARQLLLNKTKLKQCS